MSVDLLRIHEAMVTTRALDDRLMKLQRQGRIGFSIPNVGVEGVSVGAAAALRADDWVFPTYRDFGMAIYAGVPIVELMHNMFGNAKDQAQGRQMPVHFSFRDPVHYWSISSPIGTQVPNGVGVAMAMAAKGDDTCALIGFGDGGTSSAGFHSGMVFASVRKAPCVFLCQNNGWAISVPVDAQTASDGFAVKGEAYGVPGVVVDGNDVLEVHSAVVDALERARAGEGPTIVEAVTMRMGGHSTSDDASAYVPDEVFEEWRKKDPIQRFEAHLAENGVLDAAGAQAVAEAAAAEVADAVKVSAEVAAPTLDSIFSDVLDEMPGHLAAQRDQAVAFQERAGAFEGPSGEFPL